MGEILSFKNRKPQSKVTKGAKGKKTRRVAKKATPLDKVSEPSIARTSRGAKVSSKKKKETVNPASIKLWWISQEFDELIRKAVIDKHIPVEELSAVMAHRLGSLLMVSERTPELTLFCLKLISKITNQKANDSNAS